MLCATNSRYTWTLHRCKCKANVRERKVNFSIATHCLLSKQQEVKQQPLSLLRLRRNPAESDQGTAVSELITISSWTLTGC